MLRYHNQTQLPVVEQRRREEEEEEEEVERKSRQAEGEKEIG